MRKGGGQRSQTETEESREDGQSESETPREKCRIEEITGATPGASLEEIPGVITAEERAEESPVIPGVSGSEVRVGSRPVKETGGRPSLQLRLRLLPWAETGRGTEREERGRKPAVREVKDTSQERDLTETAGTETRSESESGCGNGRERGSESESGRRKGRGRMSRKNSSHSFL